MSLGFGVGDFIVVTQLAHKIRQQFVDAPSQFKDISIEVRSLSIVLQDVEIIVPQREITSRQQTELHDIADGCFSVLTDLNNTLGKYQELDSRSRSFGAKARKAWKRLNWEPEDIKELRNRIVANTILLNTFQGRIGSQISLATKDGVDRLHQRQDDQERRNILDWLTPIDYAPQQSDFIGRRQEGTGQWLLNSDEFQRWSNESKKTLFCPGIPGAGKTIMTSIVIEHLQARFGNDASTGIAYLYCSYQLQQEQNPENLLSSLLKQLAQEQPAVPADIKSLYQRHRTRGSRPSFDEIAKTLHSIIQSCSRAFIIIDALDEYHISNNERHKKLLSEVFSLQDQAQVNLFVTSRFVSEIVSLFEGCLSKEIRAQDDDILSYVNGRTPQLLRSRISKYSEYPYLQNTIRRNVLKAVDGMFLLARLHMDSLMSQLTLGHIKRALQNLPQGMKGLDETYEQAMKRIEGQKEGDQELAKRVLAWVTHAKRALSIAEVQHALAVSAGMADLDRDFLPEVEILGSICAGLITVDEKSDIIRLVHYTTQEYFDRTSLFPNAETDITVACLTYLSFENFATGFCSTDEEFEARLQLNPLYNYAARNWGYHAREASTRAEQLILELLESGIKLSNCSQAMMASRNYDGQLVPRQIMGLHLAAYFGLSEAMMALLQNGHDPNVKDTDGQTPLSWAAKEGHEAVVRLLLATDGVDPDSEDKDNQTPLSFAASNGHEAVVKLLLATDGVNPNSRLAFNERTPLSCAVVNGHEAVVKLLLAKDGIDLSPKESPFGLTPLLWAAKTGNEVVVKLMLAKDRAYLNSGDVTKNRDNWGRTALTLAAAEGREVVVKLLLATDGVDPDSKDDDGRTPLSYAAENGREMVVELLLATDGVDPDSKNDKGRTPLSYAAKNGREVVVELLLATDGVDPDSKNDKGRTPLSYAAENGREAVVELLLATDGVDPDSKDVRYGRTPILWAVNPLRHFGVYIGNEVEVVKLLLANDGVNPNSRDKNGETPLSLATKNGFEIVVNLLLMKNGIDPDSRENNGRTAVSSVG